MVESRQQLRARERDRRQAEARLLRDGLPPTESPQPTVLLARHLGGILGGRDEGRASRAAENAGRIFDVSLRHHPPRRPPDCSKGCSHCCHGFVGATIPEVLLLAGAIRARRDDGAEALRRRIADSAAATRGLDFARRTALAAPCPVLEADLCSMYPARPLACRGFASNDLAACIRAMSEPDVTVPTPGVYMLFRLRCSLALWAALKGAGLSHRSYELTEALAVALDTDDAERRWLAGEDVFADVQVDSNRPPEAEAKVEALMRAAGGG